MSEYKSYDELVSDKMFTVEDARQGLFRLMNELDGITTKSAETIWDWSLRVSGLYPSDWREVKSNIMHGVEGVVYGGHQLQIYNLLYDLMNKYGRESLTFNTVIRAVAHVKLSMRAVQERKKLDNSKPPAFDERLRAEVTDERLRMREELYDIIRTRGHKEINVILQKGRKIFNEYNMGKEPEIVLLKNGSSSHVEDRGYNMCDIAMNIMRPEDGRMDKFLEVSTYFGVENDFDELGDLVYLPLNKERATDTGGDHMYIPDKDGKEREVYRIHAYYQIISKGAHICFDRIAKGLRGNYTYDHRGWIRNLIAKGWNKDKVIVCTDMSKYSDTLDRDFIMFLLREMGCPDAIVDSLDELYSLPIRDTTHNRVLTGTRATYQGQYGDFPLITIANLVLQSFVYYKLGEVERPGYKAAVGDDTGMIFENYHENMIEVIKDVYGCVGVNINTTKTSMIVFGEGRGEFVKLEFGANGIIPFVNPRSIEMANIDQICRDILDMEMAGYDVKERMAICLLGRERADRLMRLSKINGGISDHPITEEDLSIHMTKNMRIRELLGRREDELRIWLDKVEKDLEKDGNNLYMTPLRGFVNQEMMDNSHLYDDPNEIVKLAVLNMFKVGYSVDVDTDLRNAIGKIPSELKSKYDDWKESGRDPEKRNDDVKLWELIEAYETQEAIRKRKEAQDKRKVSVYLPMLDNDLYTGGLDEYNKIMYTTMYVKSVEEYARVKEDMMKRKEASQAYSVLSTLGLLRHIDAFGKSYWYITWEGAMYRLYYVDWNSKYHLMPRSKFDDMCYKYKLRWEYNKVIDLFTSYKG